MKQVYEKVTVFVNMVKKRYRDMRQVLRERECVCPIQ